METTTAKTKITVESNVKAPIDKVWQYWTKPDHIINWNFATNDWHSPKAENDLRECGKFSARMEAKDGSFGFNFEGVYDKVIPDREIEYTMSDGRKVWIRFESKDNQTTVTETFEAESENPVDMQKSGWQMILDNFKKYTENN